MKCPFCEKSIDKWTDSDGAVCLSIGEDCECPFCHGELTFTFYDGMVLVPRDDDTRWEYEKKMELYQAIKEAISENPEVVADYRQGRKEKKTRRKMFNFLFGKIMKISKSSADTEVTTRILLEKLGLDREDVFDE